MRTMKLMGLSLMAATMLASAGFATSIKPVPLKSPVESTLDTRCGVLPAFDMPPAKDFKAQAAILSKKVANAVCRDKAIKELSAALKASQTKVDVTKTALSAETRLLILSTGNADKMLLKTLLDFLSVLGTNTEGKDTRLPLDKVVDTEGKDTRRLPLDTEGDDARFAPAADDSKMTIKNSVRP